MVDWRQLMWPAAAICHLNQWKRLSAWAKSEKLLPDCSVLDATSDFYLSLSMWIYKWLLWWNENGSSCSHFTKRHFGSFPAFAVRYPPWWILSFLLLCYVSEVLFIYSLWQLSFQSVGEKDFTVLPAVKHVTSSASVLSLVYEIECVTCFMGGHLELGRGKKERR